MERSRSTWVMVTSVTLLFLLVALLFLAGTTAAAQYGVELQLDDPSDTKTYEAPTPVQFNLTIEHTGESLTQEVILKLEDEPGGWSHNLLADTNSGSTSSSTELEFSLARGEVASLLVTIVPDADMPSGTYWLTVKAYPKKDPIQTDAVGVGVIIVQEADFELVLMNEPGEGVFKVVPPGTVTLEFGVYNLGNGEDRFHIQVVSSMCQAGWVAIFDSGVDGLGWTPMLPSDTDRESPHKIIVKVSVPAGEKVGTTCYVSINATSEKDPSLERAPVGATITTLQFYNYAVSIEGEDRKDGVVGESVDFLLRIRNNGNGVDVFRIFPAWNEEDAPGWLARAIPTEISIAPFSDGMVTYEVKLPMNATLGTYTFHAEIWSSSIELSSVSKTFYVSVLSHFDMLVWAEEDQLDAHPGDSMSFDVEVRNTGNALDSYNLSWVDWDDEWIYYLQPTSLTLSTGETGHVNVTIRVPDDLGNRPHPTYTFDLRVESVNGDREELLALSVNILSFGRIEWLWDDALVTSPSEPVATEGTLRPKPVIDVFNGTTVAISLWLRNTGTLNDNVTLWGRSNDDRITITVLPQWKLVQVGGKAEVFVQISVPDNMFPGEHRVWVNASSSDDMEVMRAVPVEFDVIPYYNPGDFANLLWSDDVNDDYTYTYTMESNDVVSSRGRQGKHREFDIVTLSGVLDLDSNVITVTMELKGEPVQDRGVFYAVYFVSTDHKVVGGLVDPKSHKKGDFVWETHDEANTVAFMYLSDQQRGSSVVMNSLNIEFGSDRVVFTVHAKDLRKAVEPGSGFRLYAYCHQLGSSNGKKAEIQLVYDTAGQGAIEAPYDFTNEAEETSNLIWLAVGVAVMVALALLFFILWPKLLPPEPEPEPTEADDWVEYR